MSLVSFLYFFLYVSSGLISSEIWHMLTFKFSLKRGLGPTQCELARNLGHQWEVLTYDPSIMKFVILHSIGRKETHSAVT